eukprot:CAMPEP_0202056138 /NCGR_PEP_ID=MMETSP0963-20130614/22404_1 /ASSEMBLY_ACC=CAM_ASM_000494 /TAXON_ID=4773 /ORGANISM="Schizochytrium aggregatum, Strain ATCC28209" /LENGTH=71 /DNA_ID=CAMNT_0048621827 /DNA_START=152 /DNA_END=363 /DNA_ORIENTATION=+
MQLFLSRFQLRMRVTVPATGCLQLSRKLASNSTALFLEPSLLTFDARLHVLRGAFHVGLCHRHVAVRGDAL